MAKTQFLFCLEYFSLYLPIYRVLKVLVIFVQKSSEERTKFVREK